MMTNKRWTVALVGAVLGVAGGCGAEVEVRKIWSEAAHSAFPDLVEWGGRYWVSFREGEAHVHGEDGVTRLLTSHDGVTWESRGTLQLAGVDLRDPKLSVNAAGDLVILQAGSTYDGKTLVKREGYVSVIPQGGMEPGALRAIKIDEKIRTPTDWLWRLSWRDGVGYGVVYQPNGGQWGLQLVKSRDALDYELVASLELPGKPSEATVRFAPDGEMWIVARNDGGDRMGRLGRSVSPYREWTWQSLGVQLGGPDLLRLANGSWVVATRKYGAEGARTMVGAIGADGAFAEKLVVPSGGDTSYPRLLEVGEMVWMVYYSSHEGRSAIYLARIPTRDLE